MSSKRGACCGGMAKRIRVVLPITSIRLISDARDSVSARISGVVLVGVADVDSVCREVKYEYDLLRRSQGYIVVGITLISLHWS